MAVWHVFWADEDYWTGEIQNADPLEDVLVRLGAGIQRVLDDRNPFAAAGIGALSLGREIDDDDYPLALYIQGPYPRLLMWSGGELTFDTSDDMRVEQLGPAASPDAKRRVLLCYADADQVSEADPLALGQAVHRLMTHESLQQAEAGRLGIRRGPRLSLDDDGWVVWLDNMLLDPATLTPEDISRYYWRPAPVVADDKELQLSGFIVEGRGVDDVVIPAGPGHLSVLFGRNGAGKSTALTAVETTLRTLGSALHRSGADNEHATGTVVLEADSQEWAPQLFSALLAHLGWSPLSPPRVQRACNEALPAWSGTSARPRDAGGLTVAELVSQPLDELRAALATGYAQFLPRQDADYARVLVDALVSSPAITVTADWRVGLVAKVGQPDATLIMAAHQCLEDISLLPTEDWPSDLQFVLSRWLRQLVGDDPAGRPLVLMSSQLLHGQNVSASVHPDSGWLQLGQQHAEAVRDNVPQPVVLAPAEPLSSPPTS